MSTAQMPLFPFYFSYKTPINAYWKQFFFFFFFIFKLYKIVLVLPNIKMNLPQVYMCSKEQNQENRIPKLRFQAVQRIPRAIFYLTTLSQCYAIAGKTQKGIPINATKYQTCKSQGSAEMALETRNFWDATSKSLLRIQTQNQVLTWSFCEREKLSFPQPRAQIRAE